MSRWPAQRRRRSGGGATQKESRVEDEAHPKEGILQGAGGARDRGGLGRSSASQTEGCGNLRADHCCGVGAAEHSGRQDIADIDDAPAQKGQATCSDSELGVAGSAKGESAETNACEDSPGAEGAASTQQGEADVDTSSLKRSTGHTPCGMWPSQAAKEAAAVAELADSDQEEKEAALLAELLEEEPAIYFDDSFKLQEVVPEAHRGEAPDEDDVPDSVANCSLQLAHRGEAPDEDDVPDSVANCPSQLAHRGEALEGEAPDSVASCLSQLAHRGEAPADNESHVSKSDSEAESSTGIGEHLVPDAIIDHHLEPSGTHQVRDRPPDRWADTFDEESSSGSEQDDVHDDEGEKEDGQESSESEKEEGQASSDSEKDDDDDNLWWFPLQLEHTPAFIKAKLITKDFSDITLACQTGIHAEVTLHEDVLYLTMTEPDDILKDLALQEIEKVITTGKDKGKGKGKGKSKAGKNADKSNEDWMKDRLAFGKPTKKDE